MLDMLAEVETATLGRFNNIQDRVVRDQGYGETVGALGVTKRFCGILATTISKKMEQVSRAHKSPYSAFCFVARHLAPEVVAASALRSLLHAVAMGDSYTPTAAAIGRAVQAECWAAGLLTHDDKLYARIDRTVRKRHGNLKYRKQAASSIAARAGYKSAQWTNPEHIAAGSFLINCALEGLPELFTTEKLGKITYLQITPEGLALAEAAVEEALTRAPVFLPTMEPLAPWTGFRRGGYWDERTRFNAPLVRAYHKETIAAVKGAMRAGAMAPHIEAVNALQSVPWTINQPVLEVVKWAYANGVPVKGIPGKDDMADLGRLSDEEWKDEPTRRLHRYRISQVKERNLGLRSNRVLFAEDITTAEKLGTEQFYTPFNCDWRGRVYAVPHFNFARDDRVRALFLFANGMPIGEEGLWWLKVHVANCGEFGGVNKQPFEERVAWTDKYKRMITRVAKAPCVDPKFIGPTLEGAWMHANKPFLFLAACMELATVQAGGVTTVTRLPLSFDGSCSGLQHLCAMTRAEEGALVNLTPQELPQDVYHTVANLASTRIAADTLSTVGAPPTPNAALAQICLAHGITRSLVKRNVMTYSYSSKKFGMAQQQVEDLMRPLSFDVLAGKYASHPFGDDDGRAASKYLAGHIHAAIEQVVSKPAQAMSFLQKCARAMAHEGKPVSWTTPTGLPWANRYNIPNVLCIRLWLSNARIELHAADGVSKEIDKDKVANGVAPNFVHALDAAHLLLTVNACVKEGITNIATVHDSFGCLAPQAVRFNQIIREEFVRMYETHDVLQEVLDACKRDLTAHNHKLLPELPSKGSLNIQEVLNAKFCFA